MSHRALAVSFVGALALVVACGGSTLDGVPGAGADGGGTSGGPTTSDGGGTSDGGSTFDATPPNPGPTGACKNDQDCNENPNVSSLWGTCFRQKGFGVCICQPMFHVQPDGKCGPAVPSCMTSGGQCVQNATMCPAGQIPGSDAANMSCGDLVPAACCFTAAQCVGPAFVCCGPTDASHVPICESGFLTCPAGYSAGPPGSGCG